MPNSASPRSRSSVSQLSLMQLHEGQTAALRALQPHRFKALRCGRRFGKTDFAKAWIADGLLRGWECAWLAPQHRTWSEVYSELATGLGPVVDRTSKQGGGLARENGGRRVF